MTRLLLVLVLVISLEYITCPPVTPAPKKPEKVEETEKEKDEAEDLFGLEYERYLKEVVSVLESDEQFRQKLEQSNISDIKVDSLVYEKYLKEVFGILMTDTDFAKRFSQINNTESLAAQSGEIARHLEFVSHGVRSKLDEIKRKEVDRLRQILRLQHKVKNGLKTINRDFDIPGFDKDKLLSHLDHKNPNTFEIDDLSKLIKQATGDLEELDTKRKDEFKEYELEKEHLRREQLKEMDETKRKEEEKKFEDMQEKHKEHPKLHHPGSKDQLEEVWEESDGLNKDDFDPKTFFFLHDTNSDGYLDEEEVEALFQKELDKVYDPNAPEDDMMERYEEMNRMREHVMNEVDQDKDKLISLKEFMESTRGDEFEKDEGWEGLDEQKLYTDEELAEFEREYEARRNQQFGGHAQPGEVNIPAHDDLQGHPDPVVQDQMHQRPPEVPQPVPPMMHQQNQQQDQAQQNQVPQQADPGRLHPAMKHKPGQFAPQPPPMQPQQFGQQQFAQQRQQFDQKPQQFGGQPHHQQPNGLPHHQQPNGLPHHQQPNGQPHHQQRGGQPPQQFGGQKPQQFGGQQPQQQFGGQHPQQFARSGAQSNQYQHPAGAKGGAGAGAAVPRGAMPQFGMPAGQQAAGGVQHMQQQAMPAQAAQQLEIQRAQQAAVNQQQQGNVQFQQQQQVPQQQQQQQVPAQQQQQQQVPPQQQQQQVPPQQQVPQEQQQQAQQQQQQVPQQQQQVPPQQQQEVPQQQQQQQVPQQQQQQQQQQPAQ